MGDITPIEIGLTTAIVAVTDEEPQVLVAGETAQREQPAGLPSGTVRNTNPQYVNAGAGDLRLQPTSPLINSGVDAPPGGTSALDAGGAARIQGPAIDIGAYEQAIRVVVVEPVPAVGPQGLAGLALLLLGAAGLAFRSRRSAR